MFGIFKNYADMTSPLPTTLQCPGDTRYASFGEEAGGNVRAMSLIHATRVLVIIIALPILLTFIWGISLDKPPGDPIKILRLNS